MEYAEYYKKAWEKSLKERTSELQEEIKTIRAENARYREALEWVLNNQHLIILAENESHVEHFTAKAREALKGE